MTAQLQHDRGQVSGRRRHHDPAHAFAAGVEDQVELLGQQGGRDVRIALDHGEGARVQVARHQLFQQGRRLGRHFRGLDDGAVARRDGSH
ncbi:hypothetical protein D3C81_1697660 [compost metagenome]